MNERDRDHPLSAGWIAVYFLVALLALQVGNCDRPKARPLKSGHVVLAEASG